MPYVLFLLVSIIWGSSFVLMKKAALALGPVTIGGGRLVSGAAVLAVAWILARGRWPLDRAHAGPVLLFVLVSYAWPYSIQPYLIARHGSGIIGTTVAFVPLLTIAISVPMLGIYPTMRQVVGVVGGLACMMLLMLDGHERHIPAVDMAMAVSVPLSYALGNTYIRRRLSQLSPLALTLSSFAIAGGMLLPIGLAIEPIRRDSHFGIALASLLFLGVVGTGLATWMFNALVQAQGPLFAGMVTYLVPIGAVVWGWLDREPVTVLQLAALAGILAMVAIVQYGAAVAPPAIEDRVP